jgi:hypothetical protein
MWQLVALFHPLDVVILIFILLHIPNEALISQIIGRSEPAWL